MITGVELRKIKRRVAKPKYPLDNILISAANDAGGDIYATIQNPASHLIYAYLAEFVMEVMKKQTGKKLEEIRILDWGCGKGYTEYLLSKQGADVIGFETEDFQHRDLWKKFNLKVKLSAGEKLPFDDKQFDAVVGFGVLEHVPYDYEALKEVNRVLKTDGLFFCFNLPSRHGYMHKVAWYRGLRYHDRLYSKKEVTYLLKRSGFNTVGKPWYRQLFPKGYIQYPMPVLIENIDIFLTSYTPACFFATSLEFVARKQYTYTSIH